MRSVGKVVVGMISVVMAMLMSGMSARAMEVISLDQTPESPPPHPEFNTATDSEYGDESDFLEMMVDDSIFWRGDVLLKVGLGNECTFRVFYHNCGTTDGIRSETYAQNTRVSVDLSGETGAVVMTATVMADNAVPQVVSCELRLEVPEGARLKYVDGSAMMVNNDPTNGAYLVRDELFSEKGAVIGTNSLSGIVLNGYEHAGYIEFRMQVVSSEETTETVVASTASPTSSPSATVIGGPPSDTELSTESPRRAAELFYDLWVIGLVIIAGAVSICAVFVLWPSLKESLQSDEDDEDE